MLTFHKAVFMPQEQPGHFKFIYWGRGLVSPAVNEGCVTCWHPSPHNSCTLTAPDSAGDTPAGQLVLYGARVTPGLSPQRGKYLLRVIQSRYLL